MKDGPNISITAAMMADPARANMLMALMPGMALTAVELGREAGVGASTTSGHLAKLEQSGLVIATRQGRHKYYRLAQHDVAEALEALVVVAARVGHRRTRPGPKDDAMRRARSCYDHLAGHLAVGLFAAWVDAGLLALHDDAALLTPSGRTFLAKRGIDVAGLEHQKRPLCRACLDWSERRHHLGGSVGAAILSHVLDAKWAARAPLQRTVIFTKAGEARFAAWCKG